MSNETSQETWNATHAQLLKSVTDAQAKLLAATNEVSDKVDTVQRGIYLHIEQHADAILARVVDVIEAKLTPPRRPVETIADIIQSQLDTLPPAVAKAKRQELHRLVVKVSKRAPRKQRR